MITGRLVVLKLEISDILPTSGIKIMMSIINSILGYIIVPIQLHHSKGSEDDICRCLCRRRLVFRIWYGSWTTSNKLNFNPGY